jgi:alcohol dehydrogenase
MTEVTSEETLGTSFYQPSDPVKQTLLFGTGCSQRVGEFAKTLGSHALVVTDPGIMTAGHPQKILDSLHQAGIKTFLFDGSVENPSDSSVQACALKASAIAVDVVIGVGGGSSLDTAKGANFILTNGGSMKDYWGVGKATKSLLPMIAIPTTAGTGSECQSYALISDDQTKRKMACGDPSALPRITLLDPELTRSQPNSVCMATAMDALAHTLESAVCNKRNPSSDYHAMHGFSLLVRNMEQVWQYPDDLDARGAVLLGAAHAGAAIERSMLGAAHALANPLTAKKGVIHGQAVSLTLPAVMSYNSQDSTSLHIYAEMAKVAGMAESGSSDNDAFEQLLSTVIRLRKTADLPELLDAVGCQDLDLEELAQDASEQWTATFNPRKVDVPELLRIYYSIKDYANR